MRRFYFWTASLLLLLIFFLAPLYAQVKYTTEGKDFWVAFLQNYGKDEPAIEPFDLPHPDLELSVFISSRKPTRGTVSIPNTPWFQDFTVAPNSIREVRIPIPEGYNWGSGGIKQSGVNITTEDSVIVFALNRIPFTADAAIILPSHALRDEYRVIAYRETPNYLLDRGITPPLPTWFSEFAILAIQDSTEIIITPTVPTRCGKPANQPFTIVLNKGQVYQLQGRGDLSGTSIVSANRTSCNVFAVFSGNVCTSVGDCAACDHLYEQIFPTRWYGKQYVLVGVDQKIYDRFRFVADSNNTKITLYEAKQGGVVETRERILNRGEFWQVDLITLNRGLSSFVEGDKPFALMQYGTGSRCDPGNIKYDPFMLMHYPLDTLLQTEVTVPAFSLSSEPNDFWNHYANLITKTDNINNITVNPPPSNASAWRTVTAKPEYSWRVVRFNNPGFYTIRSTDPRKGFSAYVYGSKRDESYGYMGAMAFQFPPLLNTKLDSVVQTGCGGVFDASAKVSVLAGEPPFTILYTWRNDSAVINTFTHDIKNIPPGRHTVIVKDLRGCINRLPLLIANPPLIEIRAADTVIACFDDKALRLPEVTLNPPDPRAKWVFPGNQNRITGTSFRGDSLRYEGLALGVYKLYLELSNGCKDSLYIRVAGHPGGRIVTVNPTCAGKADGKATVIIDPIAVPPSSFDPPFEFLWSDQTSFGRDSIRENLKDTSAINSQGRRYTVTVKSKFGCETTFDFLIKQPDPIPAETTSYTLCNKSQFTISALGGSAWRWLDDNSTRKERIVNRRDSIRYYQVLVQGAAGCESLQTFDVRYVSIGNITRIDSLVECSATLNASLDRFPEPRIYDSLLVRYSWSHEPWNEKPSVTVRGAGSYTFKSTYIILPDSDVCVAEEKFLVKGPKDTTQIYIPSAFTPNGDIRNEKWWITAKDVTWHRIMIFNRWGEEIFRSEQDGPPGESVSAWDGTANGNPVPEGVYVYVFDYKDNYCVMKQRFGTITTLR